MGEIRTKMTLQADRIIKEIVEKGYCICKLQGSMEGELLNL